MLVRIRGTKKILLNYKNVMLNQILFYAAGISVIIWGIAHMFPLKSVIKGFGDISTDNKRIVMMEWIMEGAALIFIGILVITITIFGEPLVTKKLVYYLSVVMLIAMSVISIFTGFKINFIPFKLCPVIFTFSAVLIFLGIVI